MFYNGEERAGVKVAPDGLIKIWFLAPGQWKYILQYQKHVEVLSSVDKMKYLGQLTYTTRISRYDAIGVVNAFIRSHPQGGPPQTHLREERTGGPLFSTKYFPDEFITKVLPREIRELISDIPKIEEFTTS